MLALNYTDKCFPWAIFDPYLVAGFQRLTDPQEAISVYASLEKCNHFVINRCWLGVETNHLLDSAAKADFVKRTVDAKTRKDVSRE